MFLLSRTRLALAFGLALTILSIGQAGNAGAQKDDSSEKKTIAITTVDGVELKGTYWTPKKPAKNPACIMLLHNFSRQKGGNSHADGWDALGDELAKEGYNVLSFDFRGHGESKGINGQLFFNKQKFPHNASLLKRGAKELPTMIDAKDFLPIGAPSYYPHMVDDIAAAKAFLDNKVEGSAPGNLIVIGAGEGAALGAMWMTSESRRFRDKTVGGAINAMPMLDTEPESKDLVCGVWLSLSTTLESRPVPVDQWLQEIGWKRFKLPMLFMYGQKDEKGKRNAKQVLTRMMPGFQMMEAAPGANRDASVKFTRDWAINTQLEGSELLQGSLDTNKIIKAYVNNVMEDRGSKENKRHEQEKYRYFWLTPQGRQPVVAKQAGEELMMPINPAYLGITR